MKAVLNLILAMFCSSLWLHGQINPAIEEDNFQHNGVNINYLHCDSEAEVTVLFVHGWCIDASYWSEQLNVLCSNNKFNAIAMDLPAHGKSTKNQRAWTVEAFGDDVAAVIDHLNLGKVVLVGHSMGGDIMLEAALKKPEAVIGMIGIDNFKDVGVSLDAATAQAMDQFFEGLVNNYAATINFFASQYLFSSQTDDQSKQRVVNSMLSADSVVAAEVLTELFIYSPLEIPKLEEIGKKLYLINSDYTPTITENMDKVGIAYEVMTIAGTGHYPMIEKPQEFNEILNRTLEKLLQEL